LLLASLTLAGVHLEAEAAPSKPSAEAIAAAIPLLKTAREHYQSKRYKEAAHLYHAAYQLSGDPIDLFNAARAEQRGFQLDAAEADYKRYLKAAPAGQAGVPRAKLHLQEIAEARAALAGKSAAGSPAGSGSGAADAGVARRESAGSWRSPAGWGGLGLGALGVGLGGWWLASATIDSSELDDKLDATKGGQKVISYDDAQAESDRINDVLLRGYLAAGVGAVAAGVGAWLLLSDGPKKVALTPGPRPMGLGLAMRF